MDGNTTVKSKYLLCVIATKGRLIRATKTTKIQVFTKDYDLAVALKEVFGGSYCKNRTGYNWNLADQVKLARIKGLLETQYPFIKLLKNYHGHKPISR